MNNYVLLSPVGDTDPIRDNFDGAMLHIVRHYKPRAVYLYLTEEMERRDRKDNRFEASIKRLQPACKVYKFYSKVKDAHNFDRFIDDFTYLIDEISNTYPGYEILLNISSGTPQIKSNLCLEVVTSSRKLRAVQVSSPNKSSNIKSRPVEDFDIEREFENLMDNLEEAENRCNEPDILSFRRAMIKSQVKSLISEYDYNAVFKIINDNSFIFNDKVLKLAKHLFLRYNLFTGEARKEIDVFNGTSLFPVKNPRQLKIVEYFLITKIKQKRGELAEFALRLTPLLTAILTFFIEEILKFNMEDIIWYTPKGVPKILRNKIERVDSLMLSYLDSECTKEFNGKFRDTFLNVLSQVFIAKYLVEKGPFKNNKIVKSIMNKFEKLREIENEVRNKAAHEITAIPEDCIKQICGMSSDKLVKEIEWIISNICGNTCKKEAFNIYDDINCMLMEQMDKK